MYLPDLEKTSFITLFGTFCYNFMHFGLKNAGATYQQLMIKILYPMLGKIPEVYIDDIVDSPPIHRSARLAINNMWRKSVVFEFWKICPQWGIVLFGVTTYFLFLFLKWRKLSKNKNPSMTPVKKKWSAKLDFWVRGSGYLLVRYLMRGSTLLSLEFCLYYWIGYIGAYGSKINQSP